MQDLGYELSRIPIPGTSVNKPSFLLFRRKFIGNSSPPASMGARSNPTEVAREKERAHEAHNVNAVCHRDFVIE
jgi:hypothetical protein